MFRVVLGYHFIFSAYGFWLPNDPRGSWSESVREYELRAFGRATKVNTKRSHAHDPHDRSLRLEAKRALRYPPVRFTGVQARAIARGFAVAARQRRYVVHALAILPDHAHLVMGRYAQHVDRISAHLKSQATRQLTEEGLHPLVAYVSLSGRVPSPWARNHWSVFIRSREHMHAAIRYVENNPVKSGLRAQRWSIVHPHESMDHSM